MKKAAEANEGGVKEEIEEMFEDGVRWVSEGLLGRNKGVTVVKDENRCGA